MKRLFLILLLLMFASTANAYTLTNPSVDSIYAWDDSANAPVWMTPGTGLTFSSNVLTLDSALQSLAGVTDPSAKSIYYYNGSSYEWATSLMFDVILQAGVSTAGSIGRSTDKITLRNNTNSATLNFTDDSAIATTAVIDASGFNGNLTTTDDTIQEISQKLDDLVTGGGTNTDTGSVTLDGGTAVSSSNDDVIDGGSAS